MDKIANYRSITLSLTVAKIVTKIIKSRMKSFVSQRTGWLPVGLFYNGSPPGFEPINRRMWRILDRTPPSFHQLRREY